MSYGIVLVFDNPEDCLQALRYVADADAPVFLAPGSPNYQPSYVYVGEATYSLWEDVPTASQHLLELIEKES